MLASDDRTQALAELERWISDEGATSLLRLRATGDGGGGVVARCSITPETEILSVPHELLMTAEMGRACPIGATVASSGLHLSNERQTFIALLLLTERALGPASRFHSYIAALPRALPHIPVFWRDEELALLAGSGMLQQVADRRAAVRADYDAIVSIAPELRMIASPEEWAWARAIVTSRNFSVVLAPGTRHTECLVPLADMLNHHRPRPTWWGYNATRRRFVVRSLTLIESGAEVYDSYGKKCNSRYLLSYGFVVVDNTDADTGLDLNEARLLFRLRPPDDDGNLFERRMRLLRAVDAPPVMEARLSASHAATGSSAAQAFLRFAYASERELLQAAPRAPSDAAGAHIPLDGGRYDDCAVWMCARDKVCRMLHSLWYVQHRVQVEVCVGRYVAPHPIHEHIPWLCVCVSRALQPLSIVNEAYVLAHIVRSCRDALVRYPTTLEEDDAVLEAPVVGLPEGSNARNARVLVRGEKSVLLWWIAAGGMAARLLADVQSRFDRRDGINGGFTARSTKEGAVDAVTRAAAHLHPAATGKAFDAYMAAVWRPLTGRAIVDINMRDTEGVQMDVAVDNLQRAIAILLNDA